MEAFINAACIPLGTAHRSGDLEEARALLAANPNLAQQSIHTASILGHADNVRRLLAEDPARATEKAGPRKWDALTHLCFSRFLREPPADSDFVEAARALLDAGAEANTGFYETSHQPAPCFESVLYGAAGIAHHEGLTRLLLSYGADPNDEETPYHVPESYDNGAFEAVFESGRLNEDGVATMLLRKIDFHDARAIAWLLQRGVDPNVQGRWGKTALESAIIRGNGLSIIDCLLDHGAKPSEMGAKHSAAALAARHGRGDALAAFEARGHAIALTGLDALLAACARDDAAKISELTGRDPDLTETLHRDGGRFLVEFAGSGNSAGVARLLDLGLAIDAVHEKGDPYFGIAGKSTALHAAAWRARHETVKALLDHGGADVNLPDGKGRTPLMLAAKACVESYWTEMRAPDSVAALLDAGASPEGVALPTGYAAIDQLLAEALG